VSFDWDAFFEAETNDEKFAAGADMFKMFGGSMAAGKTPPAAHYGGNTGVSAIDFSKRPVEVDAPFKAEGAGPVPSTFPPAQVSGLLGTMGTDDEYWKTILGS
tara:strand:- start:329 stop:637 length:309 start_codon:yes stop_codon:yes gene_type:complete